MLRAPWIEVKKGAGQLPICTFLDAAQKFMPKTYLTPQFLAI